MRLFEPLMDFVVDILLARLFNVRPRIRKVGETLVADTAPHIAVLTLGLCLRKVVVDPHQQAVRIHARYAWLIPVVRYVPFHAITGIVYDYKDWSFPWGTYQSRDLFSVIIQTQQRDSIVLCRFFGAGEWNNNTIFPDWLYWDEQLAAGLSQGDQESESRAYAELVSKLVGVEIGFPR